MSIASVQNAILAQFQKDIAIESEFKETKTGTITSYSTVVSGLSTQFTSQVDLGDYIGDASYGYSKVTAISGDALLYVKNSFDINPVASAYNVINIKKGIPQFMPSSQKKCSLYIGFISSSSSDLMVPNNQVAVHYGFLVVMTFKEPDPDEADDRKSTYEKILNDSIDKDPTFGGTVVGTTDLGQFKFVSDPSVEGLHFGTAPLVVTRHELRGNR